MNNINFDELDYKEIGAWPLILRILVLCLLAVASCGAVYFFKAKALLAEEVNVSKQIIMLQQDFANYYDKAINLSLYEKQKLAMQLRLKTLVQQLPKNKQMIELLENISLQAAVSGLDYDSIKPGRESKKSFYAEIPLELTMYGTYHEIGDFLYGLSTIPRIITLHDFEISEMKNKDNSKKLKINLNAKTYWAIEEELEEDTS